MAKETLASRVSRLERLLALAVAEDYDFARQSQEHKGNEEARRAYSGMLRRYALRERSRWGELTARLASLESRLAEVDDRSKSARSTLNADVQALSSETERLSKDAAEWLSVLSLGVDARELKLTRFIPVRLHLVEGPPANAQRLTEAVAFFLDAIGFDISDEFPAELGSWIKRFFAKSQEVMSQPEVAQRLEKVERALQLRGLDAPQAEVDSKYVEGTAKLIEASAGVDHAAIQIGSLLFIKTKHPAGGSIVQVLKLNQDQLLALEKNQAWLNTPEDIVRRLGACDPAFENSLAAALPDDGVTAQMLKTTKRKTESSSKKLAKQLPKLSP